MLYLTLAVQSRTTEHSFKSGGWARFGLATGLYVALAGYPALSLTIEPDRSWHPSIVSFGTDEAKGTKKLVTRQGSRLYFCPLALGASTPGAFSCSESSAGANGV